MVWRVFEGRPVTVVVRLTVASLIVGLMMMWFELRPLELLHTVQRILLHIWDMGFGALREAGQYILTGAMVVVPVWLLSKLFSRRR